VAPKNDGSATNITHAWHWTYKALGRIESATDPDNDMAVSLGRFEPSAF
jgi:hypothetical protein